MIGLMVSASILASFTPGLGYFGIYAPILCGCVVALLMNGTRSFVIAYWFANPLVATILLIATLAFGFLNLPSWLQDESRYGHAAFGIIAAMSLPGFLLRKGVQRRLFSFPSVVRYGQHAYGIYLFHPFCLELIDRAITPGQAGGPLILARFVLVVATSFAVAWLLKKWFEDPLIAIGRRLTSTERVPTIASEASSVNRHRAPF
jgi:peptidoglycan/LPS O-acetylase OafA/YrhL